MSQLCKSVCTFRLTARCNVQALAEIRAVCGSLLEQAAAASRRSAEAATATRECMLQAEEAAEAAAAEKERQMEHLLQAKEATAAAAAEKDCAHAKVSNLAAEQEHQAPSTTA
jgi:hypothetical protein